MQQEKSSNPIVIGARLGRAIGDKYKVDERMRSAVPQRLTPESFAWLKWPYIKLADPIKKQVDGIVKEAGATAISALKGEPRTAKGTQALQRLLSGKKKSK